MKQDIENTEAVIYKLEPASIRTTNHKLEIAREEKRKREKKVKRQKVKVIVVKRHKNRRGISLSSEKEENYDSNIINKVNPD